MAEVVIQRVTGSSEDTRAESFFDAIGLIQHVSTCEVDLPEGSYPETSKVSFSTVAMSHAARTTVVTFLLAPLTMLVIDKYVTVFGKADPGFMDRFFSVLLSSGPAVSFSLFFAFIISRLYIKGKITKSLLSYYVTPFVVTKFAVTIFMFMVFYIVWRDIMTEVRLASVAWFFGEIASVFSKSAYNEIAGKVYGFLIQVKTVLIKSAIYSTVVHFVCAAAFGAAYLRAYWRSYLIDILKKDFE